MENAIEHASADRPTPTASQGSRDIRGVINYIHPSVKRVNADLVAGYAPPELDPQEMVIRDARVAGTTFANEGFEIHFMDDNIAEKAALIDANRSFSTDTPVATRAFQHSMLPLLEELSQSREVVPFVAGAVVHFSDHHADKTWQPAVGMVHIDMERSTVRNFTRFAFERKGTQLKPYSRAVVYQVWQPLSPPPHDSMLALADGRTVKPTDLVLMDVRFGTGDTPADKFLSRGVYHNPDHEWYYFPDMQENEVIVFKGFDTELDDAFNPGHVAFANPQGGIPRNSVECRFVALYD